MKYSDKNKPLVCMMTQSTCYKGTRKFTPKGVLWHSTGANNPNLKRYVQPDDNASNRTELLNLLGKNQYANDWNHIDRQAGLNFWIGKLSDGTVTAVQTMPWDYRPWGCGSGSKGSCNDTHIQFEICEDGLTDKSYWNAVYREACEMTAYLCKMFNIDPKGTISYNGLKVPTIIDHTGSHALGLGSNHGDIQHWSKKYGVTMETVRNDVAAILAADSTPQVAAQMTGTASTADDAKVIWDRLYAAIQNPYGVAGAMGNMQAESGLRSNNLQNTYEKSLGMTDEQYTAAVDNGTYGNFVHDSAGYGLVQWTYWSLKEGLLNYARSQGASISDWKMQVDYFLKEIKEEYTAIWKVLTSATTVREASDAVLLKFERPADQSEAVQIKRAGYGQKYFDKYAAATTSIPSQPTIAMDATHAKYINSTGTHYISNSGSDENGAYKGGKAGDQTGNEVCVQPYSNYWNGGWECVLRYDSKRWKVVRNRMVQAAVKLARYNWVGYDQDERESLYNYLYSKDWNVESTYKQCPPGSPGKNSR